ncbi:MAG: hypothetical protein CL916_04415 [Deltaproteobacteria bacterium]|nr:hypothetical protein [Deltaproteobacteria bacterium]
MNKTLQVKPHGKGFIAQFQSATIYLCIHQMIELLQDICKNDRHLFDLSFFQFLHGKPQHPESVVEYRIFFGRVYLLLTHKEITDFLADLWAQNQSLMNFIYMEASNKEEVSYQQSPQTLRTEAIG